MKKLKRPVESCRFEMDQVGSGQVAVMESARHSIIPTNPFNPFDHFHAPIHRFAPRVSTFIPDPFVFGRARGQGKEKGRRAVETLPDHHEHYSLCPKTYFICFSFSKHCIDLRRLLNGIVSIRVGIKLSQAKLIEMESGGCSYRR